MIKKAVVGLGNPGKKYQKTRHNIGFIVLDSYAKSKKIKYKKSIKFNAEYCIYDDIILIKPKTFMNNSGFAVEKILKFYNIDITNMLVVHDDVDLPFGKIKLKQSGGSGGHNGIKSIISLLNNNDNFKRLKIGIDKKISVETKDYVLQEFNVLEAKELMNLEIECTSIIDDFKQNDRFDNLMNKYN